MARRRIKHDKPADIDTMLRHVSRRHPHALPRVLFDIDQPIADVRFVETQITARQRRVDRALCIKVGEEYRLLHIEWTYRLDRFVGARVYEYHHLIVMGAEMDAKAHRESGGRASKPMRVDSVVVVLTGPKTKRLPKIGFYRTSSTEEKFSGVRYRIEAIYERTVSELEAMGSDFWLAFAPLAVDGDAANLKRVLETLKGRTNPEDFADLAAMMLEFAHVKKDRDELVAVIKSQTKRDLTMESIIYKEGKADGLKEGLERGLERGIARGRERGIEQGREQGREQTLVHLLERRIRRTMTSGERRRIASRFRKDGPDSLGDAVLELSREELVAWLAPNGHRPNNRRTA